MIKHIIIFCIRVLYFFNRLGFKISGLGYLQRLLKRDFVFTAFKKEFYYSSIIEGSYDYLLIGRSNEPETQIFLSTIISQLDSLNFIDVGASVGEFIFSVSNYSHVNKIFAFEPRPECAYVLKMNAELNGEQRIVIYDCAVSDIESEVLFHQNPGGTSSGLYQTSSDIQRDNGYLVKTISLDSVLPEILENPIMLIDVEGSEPLVLKGAQKFINRNLPIIIFEFNKTSKRHFTLSNITSILGEGYVIWRLRGDGNLDLDFTNSWNCVAIPSNTAFADIIKFSKVQLV